VIGYRTELTSRTAINLDGFRKPTEPDLPPEDIVGAVFSRDVPELDIICTANAAAPPRYYLVERNRIELLYDSKQSGIDNRYFSGIFPRHGHLTSQASTDYPSLLTFSSPTARLPPHPGRWSFGYTEGQMTTSILSS